MHNCVRIVFILFSYFFPIVYPCSPYPGPVLNMIERAAQAEIIAYARAVSIFAEERTPYLQGRNVYTTKFILLCPLKNEAFLDKVKALALTRNEQEYSKKFFNVTEMGSDPGFCFSRHVELERNYFLFLRESSDVSHENKSSVELVLDEVNGEPAIYDDIADNRLALAEYTGDCEVLNQQRPAIASEEPSNTGMSEIQRTTTSQSTQMPSKNPKLVTKFSSHVSVKTYEKTMEGTTAKPSRDDPEKVLGNILTTPTSTAASLSINSLLPIFSFVFFLLHRYICS